jgi:hypothetical protein
MKTFAVVASGILALGLATGGTSAKDAAGQTNFRQIVATMNNVEWTINEIGQIRNVSDVTLVQLDDSTGRTSRRLSGPSPRNRAPPRWTRSGQRSLETTG